MDLDRSAVLAARKRRREERKIAKLQACQEALESQSQSQGQAQTQFEGTGDSQAPQTQRKVQGKAQAQDVHSVCVETQTCARSHKTRQALRKTALALATVSSILEMVEIDKQTHSLWVPLPRARSVLEWSSMPTSLLPLFDNNTPIDRGERKKQQCESFLRVVQPVVTQLQQALSTAGRRLRVADFGCGTGNSSLPLAYALPDCDFFLYDRFARPVELAAKRAEAAKLSNVQCIAQRIENVVDVFDLCLAFHVCGGASDEVVHKALSDGSSFVICSCCLGKLKYLNRDDVQWPHSKWLRDKNISTDQCLNLLARVADHNAGLEDQQQQQQQNASATTTATASANRPLETSTTSPTTTATNTKEPERSGSAFQMDRSSTVEPSQVQPPEPRKDQAKLLLELDRLALAHERGFTTFYTNVEPLSATPKNDIIVAVAPNIGSVKWCE